jgi:hypothetical protein
MSKSITGTRIKRKKPGPPRTTGPGTQIGTRWQQPMLGEIDVWRAAQEDQPERSEAIRRLVALGLTVAPKRGK